MIQDRGKLGEVIDLGTWRLEVTRNSGKTCDPAIGSSKGQLVSQAPPLEAGRIEVELQILYDRDARCHDPEVLVEKTVTERGGKDLSRGATQEFLLGPTTAANNQGLVDHHVAPLPILDEEDDVRDAVEEGFGEGCGVDQSVKFMVGHRA